MMLATEILKHIKDIKQRMTNSLQADKKILEDENRPSAARLVGINKTSIRIQESQISTLQGAISNIETIIAKSRTNKPTTRSFTSGHPKSEGLFLAHVMSHDPDEDNAHSQQVTFKEVLVRYKTIHLNENEDNDPIYQLIPFDAFSDTDDIHEFLIESDVLGHAAVVIPKNGIRELFAEIDPDMGLEGERELGYAILESVVTGEQQEIPAIIKDYSIQHDSEAGWIATLNIEAVDGSFVLDEQDEPIGKLVVNGHRIIGFAHTTGA